MQEQLEQLEAEYKAITEWLSLPDAVKEPDYVTKSKRHTELTPVINNWRRLKIIENEIDKNETTVESETDREMVNFITEELKNLENEKIDLTKEIEEYLIPKDPADKKSVIIEIRAGAGGDESALFAGQLFGMYQNYANTLGFKVIPLDSHPTDIGGFKQIVFQIEGDGAYSKFKYESGVHRVQRIPVTESSGRVHTSTITVAVLPEATEVDIEIRTEDIKIDTYRASGAGGQHVNTTDSAVRITHLPTGLIVTCQDERSQLKNRDRAMSVLRSKLLDFKQEEERKKRGDQRKFQIGTGDRSEKIRTYNFPQDRVTDHRINLTLPRIEDILEGNMEPLVSKLEQADRLQAGATT